jgi:hypothetical protein
MTCGGDAAHEEEHARAGIIKLPAVVALNGFYGGTILSGHICKKGSQCGERVGLQA